jgi:hypothetical protein
LLNDYGPQQLAEGDPYLTLSEKGRLALKEWRDAQPAPPKVKRRRRSEAFDGWQSTLDAAGGFPLRFPQECRRAGGSTFEALTLTQPWATLLLSG